MAKQESKQKKSKKKSIPPELAKKIFSARHNVQAREKDVEGAKAELKEAKDALDSANEALGLLIDEAEKGAGPLFEDD